MTNMVQHWFQENSQFRFRIGNVFVRGCGGNTGTYQAPPNHRQNNYYRTANTGYHDSWVDAIEVASNDGFNFSAYDTNRDKKLSGGELAVAVMRPSNPNQLGDAGFRRTATVRNNVFGSSDLTDLWERTGRPLPDTGVSGVGSIDVIDLFYDPADNDNTFKAGLRAHEMMHLLLGAADLYDNSYKVPDLPFDTDLYSIMGQHSGATHLDPFHKLPPLSQTDRPEALARGNP